MRVKDVNLLEVDWNIGRRVEGQVNFPTSTIDSPFVQKAIQEIATQTKSSPQEVTNAVEKKLEELSKLATDSPILYETINKNAAEQAVFEIFWKANVKPKGAPEFDNIVFKRLINQLRVDYDEFFPLRSYIDKRKLITPVIRVLEDDDPRAKQIPTAAATPTGEFMFNRNFMQSLMNYAHLKGVQPTGNKFKNNGGKFPPEYAYAEFVIMHEFMHYSNDDFYYQRVIPKANPMITNWVGDFRSNYQLVKSGFEALPIGLFNDKINYDRQREYVDMYNIVKAEFDRLKPDDQKLMEKILNELSDDHEPGNEQGRSSSVDIEGEEITPDELDDAAKSNGDAIEDNENAGGEEEKKEEEKDNPFADIRGRTGKPGKGKGDASREIDYSKINPQFNWKTLVDRFIKSGLSRSETTYSKPHRRSITSVDIARQRGAGAIKPAEKPVEFNDAKIMFIIDNSGSMTWVISEIMATAVKLLKMPAFRKTTILVCKYSGTSQMYKVNVAKDQAGKVETATEMPPKWDTTATKVLSQHYGGGTELTPKISQQAKEAMRHGYNVIMFTDTDILWGDNLKNTLDIIKAAPKQAFIVFDTSSSYIEFRRKTGISTPNITFFKEDR